VRISLRTVISQVPSFSFHRDFHDLLRTVYRTSDVPALSIEPYKPSVDEVVTGLAARKSGWSDAEKLNTIIIRTASPRRTANPRNRPAASWTLALGDRRTATNHLREREFVVHGDSLGL
jgi:hypothetical protein